MDRAALHSSESLFDREDLLQVLEELLALAVRLVEREQRRPRDTAVPSQLLERVLGPADPDLLQNPVGARDDALQLLGRLQRDVPLARKGGNRVLVQLEASFLWTST